VLVVSAMLGGSISSAMGEGYVQTNLVSNNPDFHPQILDPLVINAWGIALRPAGAGGHFWINNTDSGTVTEYVGDVGGTPLFQDDLKVVTVAPPPGSPPGTKSTPTGQVFSGHASDFTVSGEGLTGPSRFLFVTEDGTLSGWTERKVNGGFERQTISVITVDNSAQGAIYKGLAVTNAPSDNRLFAANFGQDRIDVWDKQFQAIIPPGLFSVPDGTIPKDYAPFNIQNLNGTLYVAYAKLSGTPGEELQGPGLGYLASFDLNGNFLHVWEGKGLLNAPWGLAIAPSDFGEFSDALLIGNFGDGTIVGYDQMTRMPLDHLRDPAGNPITIDGLWGSHSVMAPAWEKRTICISRQGLTTKPTACLGSFNDPSDSAGHHQPACLFRHFRSPPFLRIAQHATHSACARPRLAGD
ncbi:MAG: TIGR03118 family protein, partial [Nitrospiraceae bacterium]